MHRLAPLALLLCCAPPKSSLPPGQVLAFGALDQDAAVSIVIHEDGNAIGVIHWPDKPQEEHHGVLSSDELTTLRTALGEQACCRVKSRRVYAYAEEPRVTLSIRWGGLDCAIELWEKEWEELPRARRCAEAVRSVIAPDPEA
jgi:hypothetical protein